MNKEAMMCANCTKTACAKQVIKERKIVLFCSAYKPKGAKP